MGQAFGFCMACMSGCDAVRFDFVILQYFVCIAFVGPGVEQGVELVIEPAADAKGGLQVSFRTFSKLGLVLG